MEVGSDAHWVLSDKLLLSRAPKDAPELLELRALGVTHVLSLIGDGAEEEWSRAAGIRFLSWPLMEMGAPTVPEVAGAVDRVGSVLSSTRNVLLVHCHAGVGRSGVVAASYLGASAGLKADEAVEWVRGRRPSALWSQDKVGAVEDYLGAFAKGTSGTEGSRDCLKCGKKVLRPSRRCFSCSKLPTIDDFFDRDPVS